MPTKCCWVIYGRLTSERKASTSPPSFINHSTLLLDRALKRQAPRLSLRALDRLRMRRRVYQGQRADLVIICMITCDFSLISMTSQASLSLYYSQKSLMHNTGSASVLPIIREQWTKMSFGSRSLHARIYPSSKWSSQWPYDGYTRHGRMTSCGRGSDSATPECFGRGSQGTIFVRSPKLSLFFSELCAFRRVFFVSCAFVKFGAKRPSPGAFGFDNVFELFLKTALRQWAFSCELRLWPRVFFENFHSFFKAEPVLLAWQLW